MKKIHPPKQLVAKFIHLEKLPRLRLKKTMEGLGLSEATQKEILKTVKKSPSQMEHQFALILALREFTLKNRKAEPLEFNPFVRDFQALTNHTFFTDEKGAIGSGFVWGLIGTLESLNRKNFDLEAYLTLTLEAHLEVDAWGTIGSVHGNKQEEYLSITHHVLDWYLQVCPQSAINKTPKKCTALAFGIVNKVNHSLDKMTLLSNSFLAKKGEWKTSASFGASMQGPFYDTLYSVEDIQLLIMNPTVLPRDWPNRLQAIAPALSPETLGLA